ncbi:sigma-70 family RNA polymerase sigma factor [Limnobacter sp.]|uniref:sigma-70 family RNA polymerase sigma factor n=1 Tax=Limnobacter sp. TaxID=2003368 RepID=UPI003511C8FD
MTQSSELNANSSLGALEAKLKPMWLLAQEGNERAYKEALGMIALRLRQFYGRRLQGAPEEVEDVVQETLITLHLQRATYDSSLPVTSWIHAIARHKLVDVWRRRGRKESLHSSFDELHEQAQPLVEPEFGTRQDLMTLLALLPDSQREALILTKIEGLSVEEASLKTGASVSSIKVQVHRALKKLSALVGDGA